MSRKMSLVEIFCQKLVSFLSNNQKIKEDKREDKVKLRKDVEQEDKVKLRRDVQQELISVNSFENFLAERMTEELQVLLDNEKIKLSDREREEVVSAKKSLKKAQDELVELINVLVKKEEYVKNDLDMINAKGSLIRELFRKAQFVHLQVVSGKK
ncbi:MAG: hypothetical protein WA064_03720 [Candidatus Moraniibacteriota bacterium]|jgi:hypothetical protein